MEVRAWLLEPFLLMQTGLHWTLLGSAGSPQCEVTSKTLFASSHRFGALEEAQIWIRSFSYSLIPLSVHPSLRSVPHSAAE